MSETSELYARQGMTKQIRYIIKDADNAVQNLTGFAATFKVTPMHGAGVTATTKTIGSGIAATVATGTLVVSLAATDTCIASAGDYYFSLVLTDASSQPWDIDPPPERQGVLHVTTFGTE